MKSKFSRLAVGCLIASGTVSQASPTLAEVYTKPFTTPVGDGIFSYDSNKQQANYSLSNPSNSYYVYGVFQYDINTWRGNNYGTFQESNSYGTYWQNFPLGTLDDLNKYTFNHDPSTNTTTWTEGDPNSSFFRVGAVNFDTKTSQGSLSMASKENRSTGTYTQNFGSTNIQPVTSENSFNYDPTNNKISWSQSAPGSSTTGILEYDPTTSMATVTGKYSNGSSWGTFSQQYPMTNPREPEIASPFPGTIARRFSTPQGDGVYAYDINNNRLIYALGDPNSSFFSTGGFVYDVDKGEGDILITYQNNGTTGGYTRHFSSESRVEAVPEPESVLLNTLAFGGVLGAGLIIKRQKKKRKAAILDTTKL